MTTTGWILITNFERGNITQPSLEPLNHMEEGLGSTSSTARVAYNLHFPYGEQPTATKDNEWLCDEGDQRTAFRI